MSDLIPGDLNHILNTACRLDKLRKIFAICQVYFFNCFMIYATRPTTIVMDHCSIILFIIF
jgi:hypothetical protein